MILRQNLSAPSSIVRFQIGLAFLAFILIGANDGAIGVLLPSLQRHYGVDKAIVGLLFLASTTGYLAAAFSSGLLTEKLGTKLFLAVGAVSFLVGALAFALMLPFAILLVMLLALGFGIAVIDAGLNSYIAAFARNAALLNYLHAFYGVGALLGPLLATLVLAASWGWNSVYVIWAILSAMLVAGFALFFNGRGPAPHGETHAPETGNVLVAVLKLRVVWLASLFLLLYVGAEASLGSWGYSFLTEERHEVAFVSGWIMSGYWMGLTGGRFLLGRAAQRVGNRRMIELCLAGVVVGVLLVWLAPGLPSAFGLWLTGFCLGPVYPTTIALMSQLAPSRLLPSAVGILASAGSLGAALFSWQAGNFAQAFGLWTLLPFVIATTLAMLLSWFALTRSQST